MTTTTLSVAVTSINTPFVTLASVTGLVVGDLIQIDNEWMEVSADPNTTTLVAPVIRGFQTRAVQHGAGSVARFGKKNEFGSLQGSYGGPQFLGGNQFADGLFFPRKTPVAQITTAGAFTYLAGQLLAGLILRDPNGAGRSDVTPTAALLIAALPGCDVGTTFSFRIQNDADAAETITITAGTGATLVGTMTIAQSNSKAFEVRITNITAGSEAYTLYNLGTFTS